MTAEPQILRQARNQALEFLQRECPDLLAEARHLAEQLVDQPTPQELALSKLQNQSGLISSEIPAHKLGQQWLEGVTSASSINEALSTAFWQKTSILTAPSGLAMADQIPLIAPNPSPFHKQIVHLKTGSLARLTDACNGTKSDEEKLKASAAHFYLENSSKLYLVTFQDWQGVRNTSSRHFHLSPNAELHWLDIHLGQCPEPTTHSFSLSKDAALDLKTLVITRPGDKIKLTYDFKGQVPEQMRHDLVTLKKSLAEKDIQSNAHINQVSILPPDAQTLAYLNTHGLSFEDSRDLHYQNALKPYLKGLGPEFQVEIMSRL